MNNFYFIDKSLGFSSFDIIRKLRKILNIKKIGHTGTLDPLATGGLLVATGNYTKLISFFEKDIKEYEFQIMLNGTTDSFDLGEEVQYISKEKQEKYEKDISLKKIENILKEKFSGEREQIPPKYSALKIAGKKAYELAREGKEVEMKPRKITINEIEILSFNYPKLDLRANVSAGTYIRSIANDLGEFLGTGGYISKLRRTKVGSLDISLAQNLECFDKDIVLNEKEIFKNKLFIQLDGDILKKLDNGLTVKGYFDFKVGENLFVEKDGKVAYIVEYDGIKLIPKRKI